MRVRSAVTIIVTASLLVHGGVLFWMHSRSGSVAANAFRSLDCDEYYAIARNLVAQGAFSQSQAPPPAPDTWRTPGYPLFLAGAMLFTGASPSALIALQHLLAVSSTLIFFALLRRFVSPGKAALGAFLFLLEPYHLFYASWLLNTTWFTFGLLVTWWLWERTRHGASLWHYGVMGLLSGFLVLIWPGAILIPAGLLICTFLHRMPDLLTNRFPHRKLTLLTLGVMSIVPPALWMSRNKLVAGHFALSHQSGIVLAYFKATEVELWRKGLTQDRYLETSLDPARRDEPHAIWDSIDARLCERMASTVGLESCADLRWFNLAQGNKTAFDSFEISRHLSAIGKNMLLESPMSSAVCGAARVAENLTFPLNLALSPAAGASTSRPRSVLLGTAYLGLLVAAVVGVWRARNSWRALLLPVACIIGLSLTTSPQIDPRFRVPMIPFLVFLALLPFRRAESQ